MLVLSRKPGERLWIGDQIAVTILDVSGRSVRVGIEAPSEIQIVREELRLPDQEKEPSQRRRVSRRKPPLRARAAT